ncbi:O-antigen ligase family protein [Kamptonema cortianum]|nr:O-antigen ligase family protein [Geitlerinema splendidum]MDK3156252.1 O-antigen ligase family protein [Kamptonema cortianum]
MSKSINLGAPYVRGETRTRKSTPAFATLVCFIILVGMPVVYSIAALKGLDLNTAFTAVWAFGFVAAVVLELRAKPAPGITAFHLAAVLIPLIGLPGLAILRPSTTWLVMVLGYTLILFFRQAVLCVIIPKAIHGFEETILKRVFTLMIVGGMVVCIGSMMIYAKQGITVFNPARYEQENWMHPGTIGNHCAFVVLATLLTPHIPKILRISAAVLAMYVVLTVQSRTILVALTLTVLLHLAMEYFKNPRKHSLSFFISVVLGIPLIIVSIPWFMSLGAVKNMYARTFETSDPFARRGDFIQIAIDAWRESPLFGYGWRSGLIDNVVAQFGMQLGLVGTLLYFAFFFWVLGYAVKVYRTTRLASRKQVAHALILFGAFITMASLSTAYNVLQLTDLVANTFMLLAGFLFFTKEPRALRREKPVPI